jgi:ribose transport system substrate-binding protein
MLIGCTVQSTANPYFVSLQNGVQAEGKLVGATTSLQDGQMDVGHQTDIVDDFIQERVGLILINAVDSAGIAPAIERARQANIPVVAVDVGAQGGVNATVTSDNVQAGRIAAQYMATRLHGVGKIAVIDGPPVTAVQDRDAGLKEVLQKYPRLSVVSTQIGDGSRDRGLQLGVNILTANPHLDAVFAINDPTALGMELAAKQANRSEFFIVSVDGSPDVVKDMKAHGLIAATAAQAPNKLGKMAVQIGMAIAAGKKPPADVIKLPVTLVTQDNVNGYAGWN